jgi:hypothetical protein
MRDSGIIIPNFNFFTLVAPTNFIYSTLIYRRQLHRSLQDDIEDQESRTECRVLSADYQEPRNSGEGR